MLRERDFALFFWGQAVSLLGDGIFPIALAFAVLDLGGSPTDLGIVLVAGILPQTLFVLIGGVWADRLPRRTIMLAADAARALIQAVTARAPAERRGAASGSSSCSTRCTPRPRRSSCPRPRRSCRRSTPRERLQQANALLGVTRSIAFGLGAALGGVFVSLVSTGGAVALDACTFVDQRRLPRRRSSVRSAAGRRAARAS